jgi:hypothetical protein
MRRLACFLFLALTLFAQGHTVTLTWTASTTTGVTGYYVFRSRYPTGCTSNPQVDCIQLNSIVVACCDVTDPSVIAGDTYYYWLTAYCSACSPDQSDLSNEAEAIVP